MRFYTHRHKYYCGIDLHTSVMYVCLTDEAGNVLVHKNLKTTPEALMRVIEPYREDLAIAVERSEPCAAPDRISYQLSNRVCHVTLATHPQRSLFPLEKESQ